MAELYDPVEDKDKRYYLPLDKHDAVLDGLDFATLIMELSANYRKEKIDKEAVFKQFSEDLSIRIEDAHFLLNLCIDKIIEEAKE